MANNPFYPGYVPKKSGEESTNPIYPGYFPGQAVQRRPTSKNFIKPIEYNVDAIMEGIDNAGRKVLFSPLAGPRWFVERVVDDWKQNLKVSIKPADTNITDLDDYATEDFPGITISASLNPLDYKDKKGLKKQITKTFNSYVKETIGINPENLLDTSGLSDIQNRTTQQLWSHVLGYGEPEDISADLASSRIAERTAIPADYLWDKKNQVNYLLNKYKEEHRDKKSDRDVDSERGPLSLKGSVAWKIDSSTGKKVVERDIYHNAAKAASEFSGQWDNFKDRDKLHSKFLYEATQAANKEIQTQLNYGKPQVKALLQKHDGAIALFDLNAQVAGDINRFTNNKLGDKKAPGWKDAGDQIQKNILEKRGSTGLGYVWDQLENATKEARSNNTKRLGVAKQLLNAGKISEGEFGSFEKNIKACEDYYTKLSTATENAKTGASSGDAVLRILNGSVGTKSLNKRDVFRESILGDIGKDMEHSLLSNDRIAGVFRDEALAAQGVSFNAGKIGVIANRLRRERVGGATKELLSAWDDEKLLERYAWKAIKDRMPTRLRGLASGEPVKKFLENRYYFGLTISQKPEDLEKLNDLAKQNPEKFGRFRKRFEYKERVKFDKETAAALGISSIAIVGGDQFKILNHELIKGFDISSIQNKEILMGLFGGGETNLDDIAKKFFGHGVAQLTDIEKEVMKSLMKQSKEYTEWVKSLRDQFGDKVDNPLFRYTLFKELNKKNDSLPMGYGLTRQFIGRLDKIHKQLMSIKARLEASRFGKAIKFFQNWKTIVSEQVAQLVSKLLAKLVGAAAAATGVLAVLLPIIEKVVEFAVKKTLVYLETWVRAIVKWDFRDLVKLFEKDVYKVIKFFIVCCTGCSLIIALPIFIILMLVAGSVSPIDKTIGTSNYDIGSNARNENDIVKIEKSVVVILPDGTILAPPRDPIPNTVLDNGGVITVQYTVKVTAKVTIVDPGPYVSVEDLGRVVNKNGSKKFFGVGEFEVKPFVEGDVYTYSESIWNTTISGDGYKDSLIVNTAFAYTPETEDYDADTVESSATFVIGNPPVSETPGCEGSALNDSPLENPQAGGIAQVAFSIVQQLERGFWCSFNKPSLGMSTTYSHARRDGSGSFLFNGALFDQVGAGGDPNGDGNDLFWCTWLIIKSYQSQGFSIGDLTGTASMEGWFREDHSQDNSPNNKIYFTSTANNKILATDLRPGDVIFYESRVYNGRTYGHVGLVYNIDLVAGNVQIIQSNSDSIVDNINVDADGYVAQRNVGGRGIKGFGRVK